MKGVLEIIKNITCFTALFFSICCLLFFGFKVINKFQINNTTPLEKQFVKKIIRGSDKLKYPPIDKTEDLNFRINQFLIDTDSIEFAFKNIKLESSKKKGKYIEIHYTYKNRKDTAFTYLKASMKELSNNLGVLVIPGSGINQSSEIYYKNDIEKNYQSNIDDIFSDYGDVFILVKPNEDFLAIHNGDKKIDESSFVNYLLNKGSSYSAYYFIQSLVVTKFIKENYKETIVTGLSQGGYVALLNSLQAKPNKAIVASGFSILFDEPHQSGHNQFIVPGHNSFFNSDEIRKKIGVSNTSYLFTYGKGESGIYGKEAREYFTKKYFKSLENVKVDFHSGGHIYDIETITNFINANN